MTASKETGADDGRRGRRGRRVWRLLRLPLLLVIAGVILRMFGCIESATFYFPSREAFVTPRGVEDVTFANSDGQTLHGWFMPAMGRRAGDPPTAAVLHVHGNAGNVSSHADFSAFLPRRDLAVLVFDYRGYGRSSEARGLTRGKLMEDTRAAYRYLVSRPDVDPARVGVYGVSVGGSFALALAAEEPGVRCVCTVSAFSGWGAVAGDHLPVLGPALIGGGLEPAKNAARLGSRPLLVVHGDADTIVPPYHAERIEAAARGAGVPVRRRMVAGGDHNDAVFMEVEPSVQEEIGEFFVKELAPRK